MASHFLLFLCVSVNSPFYYARAYAPPMTGACRGPGGIHDKVNSRHATEKSQSDCEDACSALAACVGYAHCEDCNNGECILYGAGVDGTCSNPIAKNQFDCEALGSCSDVTKTSEDECGRCSEPTATSRSTCDSVGANWVKETWSFALETWEDAEDPWTGDSHFSTTIRGTTEDSSSKYICVDADPEDHYARCSGSNSTCTFDGLEESARIEDNCPEGCVYTPAPTAPKPKPPHAGDIKLPGWGSAMSGACRGGTDFTDKVNGKYSNTAGADGPLTQQECASACLDEPTCVGYSHSTAWCVVYGPVIHETVGEFWTSDNHEEVTITGTKANPSYICVTGPPRDIPNETKSSGSVFYAGRLSVLVYTLIALVTSLVS